MSITTLSSTAIQNRKAETLNSQSIRKTIAVREINLIDDTTIEYNGKRLEITKDAFKRAFDSPTHPILLKGVEDLKHALKNKSPVAELHNKIRNNLHES